MTLRNLEKNRDTVTALKTCFIQYRGLACERGLLNRADGSAKWTQDQSSVLAAVYGPRQAQLRKEDAEQAVIEVVFKPRSGFQGERSR